MPTKYKHILFDLDNTLWDFETNSKNTLKEVFFKYKLDNAFSDFNQFHSLYIIRNTELWNNYGNNLITKKTLNFERFNYPLQKVGIYNPILVETLSADYLRICAMQKALMPHANETLEYLKEKNYQMHILSNGFAEVQYTKLKHSGLVPYIDQVILSENVGVLKPDKRIFDYAIKKLQAHKNEVLMIGDNFDADIAGAKKAGIDQLYYNYDNTKKCTFTPTYAIQSLSEIKSIL